MNCPSITSDVNVNSSEAVEVMIDKYRAVNLLNFVRKTKETIQAEFKDEREISNEWYEVICKLVKSFGESTFNLGVKDHVVKVLSKIENFLCKVLEIHFSEISKCRTAW